MLAPVYRIYTRQAVEIRWRRSLTAHYVERWMTARSSLAEELLQEPEWRFLDKATSALDEATERQVYELLAARLPRTTVVSVVHRPAVAEYRTRRWTFAPGAGRVSLEVA